MESANKVTLTLPAEQAQMFTSLIGLTDTRTRDIATCVNAK